MLGIKAKQELTNKDLISEYDLYSYHNSTHYHSYKFLGTHALKIKGQEGMRFMLWAPHAKAISIVGSFNNWNLNASPMHKADNEGIWMAWLPRLGQSCAYQYAIHPEDGTVVYINDPFASELKFTKLGSFYVPKKIELEAIPERFATVSSSPDYIWSDETWIKEREKTEFSRKAISILNIDLNSTTIKEHKNYQALAKFIVKTAQDLAFTHVSLTSLIESITDLTKSTVYYKSIQYQFFAAQNHYGSPDDLKTLINYCHASNIGVILDLPYFSSDCHLIKSIAKKQVQNFFLSNLIYWLEEFHFDGFKFSCSLGTERVIDFIKTMNEVLHSRSQGAFTIVEEKRGYPSISKPTYLNGLGFNMKIQKQWEPAIISSMEKNDFQDLEFCFPSVFAENQILSFSDKSFMKLNSSELKIVLASLFELPGKKYIDYELMVSLKNNYLRDEYYSVPCRFLAQELSEPSLEELLKKLNHTYQSNSVYYETDFKDNCFEWKLEAKSINLKRWSRDFSKSVEHTLEL